MRELSYEEVEKFFKELLKDDVVKCTVGTEPYTNSVILEFEEIDEVVLEKLETVLDFLKEEEWYIELHDPYWTTKINLKNGKVDYVIVGLRTPLNLPVVLYDKLEESLQDLEKNKKIRLYKLEENELYVELLYDQPTDRLDLKNKFERVEELVNDLHRHLQYLAEYDELVIAGTIAEKVFGYVDHVDTYEGEKDGISIKYSTVEIDIHGIPFSDLSKVKEFHEQYVQQLSRLREEWLKKYSKIPDEKELVKVELTFTDVRHEAYVNDKLSVTVSLVYHIDERSVGLIKEHVRTTIEGGIELEGAQQIRKEISLDYVHEGDSVEYKDVVNVVRELIQQVSKGLIVP